MVKRWVLRRDRKTSNEGAEVTCWVNCSRYEQRQPERLGLRRRIVDLSRLTLVWLNKAQDMQFIYVGQWYRIGHAVSSVLSRVSVYTDRFTDLYRLLFATPTTLWLLLIASKCIVTVIFSLIATQRMKLQFLLAVIQSRTNWLFLNHFPLILSFYFSWYELFIYILLYIILSVLYVLFYEQINGTEWNGM